MNSILILLGLFSFSAEAKQNSTCAARHFVCLRECTKDMTRSQKECEKEEHCGPLSQCEQSYSKFTKADLAPQGLEKCDEDLGRRTADCDKISDNIKALECSKEALREYRRCTAGMRAPSKKSKAIR